MGKQIEQRSKEDSLKNHTEEKIGIPRTASDDPGYLGECDAINLADFLEPFAQKHHTNSLEDQGNQQNANVFGHTKDLGNE